MELQHWTPSSFTVLPHQRLHDTSFSCCLALCLPLWWGGPCRSDILIHLYMYMCVSVCVCVCVCVYKYIFIVCKFHILVSYISFMFYFIEPSEIEPSSFTVLPHQKLHDTSFSCCLALCLPLWWGGPCRSDIHLFIVSVPCMYAC